MRICNRFGAGRVDEQMVEQSERYARLLVRALYEATRGESSWWYLSGELRDFTKEAIAVAVDRGWVVLDRGEGGLTDSGRDVARGG